MSIIYLNGMFVDQMEASLDPLDRGVLLGDGLFETIRCEEGQLLFHVAHFARLARSARIVELPWNMNSDELLTLCHQCLDANGLRRARLRITVTRGELGASPEISAATAAPTVIISVAPIDQPRLDQARQRGWKCRMVPFPINHRSPLAEIKSTSYQEKLLARHVARRDGFDEGLLLNTDGLLAEGSMCNVFLVRDGRVYTPPVHDGALPGVVRLKIGLICGRLGIDYREESLTLQDLEQSDEAFFTNSIIEVVPMIAVGEKRIGNGYPGPLSQQLFAEHRRDVGLMISTLRGQ